MGMPTVIDNIWFNEGFGRCAAIAALTDGMPAHEGQEFRQGMGLRNIVSDALAFIRRMPIVVLSRKASFL